MRYRIHIYGLSIQLVCSMGIWRSVYRWRGVYVSTYTLSLSSLSFSSCPSTRGGKGVCITASTLSLFTAYSGWNDLLPSSYSSDNEGVYTPSYSTSTIPLLHLLFSLTPSPVRIVYASTHRSDIPLCGWSDCACKRLLKAVEVEE